MLYSLCVRRILLTLLFAVSGCGAQVASVHVSAPLLEAPTEDSQTLATLQADTIVTVTGDKGEFFEVRHGDLTGYLRKCLSAKMKESSLQEFQKRTQEAQRLFETSKTDQDPLPALESLLRNYADTRYAAPAIERVVRLQIKLNNGDPIATLAPFMNTCPQRVKDSVVDAVGRYARKHNRLEEAVAKLSRPATGNYWVSATRLSVREAPHAKSKRVFTAGYGTRAELTARFGSFREVKAKGQEGWVAAAYLADRPPINLQFNYGIQGKAGALRKITFRQKGRALTGTLVNRNGRELLKHRGTITGDDISFKCIPKKRRACSFKGTWQNGNIVGTLVYTNRRRPKTYQISLVPQ